MQSHTCQPALNLQKWFVAKKFIYTYIYLEKDQKIDPGYVKEELISINWMTRWITSSSKYAEIFNTIFCLSVGTIRQSIPACQGVATSAGESKNSNSLFFQI